MEIPVGTRMVSLEKDGHRYCFAYSPGEEEKVASAILRQAEDGDSDLDWLDAARLAQELVRQIGLQSD